MASLLLPERVKNSHFRITSLIKFSDYAKSVKHLMSSRVLDISHHRRLLMWWSLHKKNNNDAMLFISRITAKFTIRKRTSCATFATLSNGHPVHWWMTASFFFPPCFFRYCYPFMLLTVHSLSMWMLNINYQITIGTPSLVRNVIVLPTPNEELVISQLLFPSLPPEEQQGDNAWEGRKVPTPHSSYIKET